MPFLAYFAVMLIAAASVAFGMDLLNSPLPQQADKPAVNRHVAKAVRQIPLGRATAQYNGDPENKLSPVHPAHPGGALAEAKATSGDDSQSAPVTNAAATSPSAAQQAASAEPSAQQAAVTPQPAPTAPTPAAVSMSTSSVSTSSVSTTASLQRPAAAEAQTIAQRSNRVEASRQCNVEGCAATYRSFNAADCTYQAYDGARRLCESPAASGNRRTVAQQPPMSRPIVVHSARNDDLEEAVRAVKRLPVANRYADRYDADEDGEVVVMERPVRYYRAYSVYGR